MRDRGRRRQRGEHEHDSVHLATGQDVSIAEYSDSELIFNNISDPFGFVVKRKSDGLNIAFHKAKFGSGIPSKTLWAYAICSSSEHAVISFGGCARSRG
ncbi:hypothetical protein PRUPE_2G051500 [Prunus persica]|uniref:Uncharacterized protein n=1 Tax=Prunus persica TaxID=3760 RepID=A0A251QCP5_PRUPE|nr:hypothetical protein PRUPE_2G051500 [Prunus persica]